MVRIGDYAIIGDGRSVALVGRTGSIDWLCWPRFESSPIFGALLDERAGAWRIAPTEAFDTSRRYRADTNVLDTTFATASGRAVVTDLMAIASERDKRTLPMADHELVRCVRCVEGVIELAVEVAPRPDFARRRVRPRDLGALGLRWEIGSSLLTLRGEAPLALDDTGAARGLLRLRAGERALFSLAYDAEGPAVLPILDEAAIDRTERWWRAWAARAAYGGRDRDAVVRSALALKLMSFAPSGAIVAAPTTSLPERDGGPLNWDYRYCWLRDAAFTARALLDLGYVEDAQAFCGWLLHATRLTQPALRVMYDVYGKLPPHEREVPNVAGFHGSSPVRIGNVVNEQLQLDVYGEVIDATAQIARREGHLDRDTQELLRAFGSYVCRHWRLPDAGIWEPREPNRHRTHSRLCCWVALDRLIDLCERRIVRGIDPATLADERAAIRRDIELHAFDDATQSYASELGGDDVDASLLQMSWFRFHAPDSPRLRSTYGRICEQLGVAPALFYRNGRDAARDEGAFWICSYWAAEHLACGGGTPAEARRVFEQASAYANDVGLMSEEVDPHTGALLGNFPQAYTHVGLIDAAIAMERHGC